MCQRTREVKKDVGRGVEWPLAAISASCTRCIGMNDMGMVEWRIARPRGLDSEDHGWENSKTLTKSER